MSTNTRATLEHEQNVRVKWDGPLLEPYHIGSFHATRFTELNPQNCFLRELP